MLFKNICVYTRKNYKTKTEKLLRFKEKEKRKRSYVIEKEQI